MSTGLFTFKARPCVRLSLRLQAACASAISRLENLRGIALPLRGQLWFSNISRECIRLDAELKDLEQALWLRFPNLATAPNGKCQYDVQKATTALLGSCALTLMVLCKQVEDAKNYGLVTRTTRNIPELLRGGTSIQVSVDRLVALTKAVELLTTLFEENHSDYFVINTVETTAHSLFSNAAHEWVRCRIGFQPPQNMNQIIAVLDKDPNISYSDNLDSLEQGTALRTSISTLEASSHNETIESTVSKHTDESSECHVADCDCLYSAIWHGRLDIVEYLIAIGGEDVNQVDSHGLTPLHWCCDMNHGAIGLIISTLVNYGADLDFCAPSAPGQAMNPLRWALKKGNLTVVRILVTCGANVAIKDSMDRSLVHEAVQYNYVSVVDCLLEMGSNPGQEATLCLLDLAGNRVTYEGCSLIHFAMAPKTSSAMKGMIELLARRGLDIDLKSVQGLTPVSLAFRMGRDQTLAYLCNYFSGKIVVEILKWTDQMFTGFWPGAGWVDLDAEDRATHRRAAPIAAETRDYAKLGSLIQHGASFFLEDGSERSCLGWAAYLGDVRLLAVVERAHGSIPAAHIFRTLQWHLASAAMSFDFLADLMLHTTDVPDVWQMMLLSNADRTKRIWILNNLVPQEQRSPFLDGRIVLRCDSACDLVERIAFNAMPSQMRDITDRACMAAAWATFSGVPELLQYLLTVGGVRIRPQPNNKFCPLRLAIKNRDVFSIDIIVEHMLEDRNVVVNTEDDSSVSERSGKMDRLVSLLQAYKAVFRSAKNHDLAAIQLYVSKGLDFTTYVEDSDPPLVLVANSSGNAAIAQYMLDNGADPSAVSGAEDNLLGSHLPPLTIAAHRGFTGLVYTLLRAGSDPNVATVVKQPWFSVSMQYTALGAACQFGHFDAALMLLHAGADSEFEDQNCRWSPLFFAIHFQHFKVAEQISVRCRLEYLLNRLPCDCRRPELSGLMRRLPRAWRKRLRCFSCREI